MTGKLFCFGWGYSARHFYGALQRQDPKWQMSGTTTQPPKGTPTQADIHVFDGQTPLDNALDLLTDVSHMLISIPPQKDIGDPVLHHHGAHIAQLKNLKWLGYLSTTGVYGDHDGGWVDEETAPSPTSSRGAQRLAAEQGWLKLWEEHQVPVHIFRLGSIYGPSIYGPGRGQHAQLVKGTAKKILKSGQYFSRIHVEDIAQALTASLTHPDPGRIYNLVDNHPTHPEDVLDYVCDLMGRPHLPEITIDDTQVSPMMRSFYSENKRVRNGRMVKELGVTLKYPSYREGFRTLVKETK